MAGGEPWLAKCPANWHYSRGGAARIAPRRPPVRVRLAPSRKFPAKRCTWSVRHSRGRGDFRPERPGDRNAESRIAPAGRRGGMRQVSRPPASVVDRARSEPHRTTIPAIRWENFQLAEVGFFDLRAQDSRAPRGWLGRTVAFACRAKRERPSSGQEWIRASLRRFGSPRIRIQYSSRTSSSISIGKLPRLRPSLRSSRPVALAGCGTSRRSRDRRTKAGPLSGVPVPGSTPSFRSLRAGLVLFAPTVWCGRGRPRRRT